VGQRRLVHQAACVSGFSGAPTAAVNRMNMRGSRLHQWVETMTHDPASPSDPPPIPPVAPDPGDCCGEGCVNCIYDVYEASLERYRTLLEAWQARHPDDAEAHGPAG
jgi:hypothetical protein